MTGSYDRKHSSCACRYARQCAVDLLKGSAWMPTRRPSSGWPSSACPTSSRARTSTGRSAEATKKKKIDCSTAEYLMIDEGLCVQCLHVGSYDDEPATVEAMDTYVREQGYVLDLTRERCHHEIYLRMHARLPPRNSRRLSATPSSRLRIAEGRGTDDAARGSCAGGHGGARPATRVMLVRSQPNQRRT